MPEIDHPQIIQVIPAPVGMTAVYLAEDGERIICPVMFALYRWPDGATEVRTLALTNCDSLSFDLAQGENFSHFAMNGKPLPTMLASPDGCEAPTVYSYEIPSDAEVSA